MDALESRMDALESRMDALEVRMDALESRMDTLETRVDNLETRVGALETRTGALETQVDAMAKSIKEYVNKEVRDVMDYATESNKEIIHRLDGIDKHLDYLNFPQNSQAVYHFRNR